MESGLPDHVQQHAVQQEIPQSKFEGQRIMLRELLEARFGPLEPAVVATLECWPGDRLTELGRAVASASSLEELGLGTTGQRDGGAASALAKEVHSLYRRSLLCEFVIAYFPIDEEQRQEFEDMVRNHPDPLVKAMGSGLLDHVEQRTLPQGVREGLEEGVERGRLQGQREMLRNLLETRFGPLSPAVANVLEAWPANRLVELGRSLLSAGSLEELGLRGVVS